MDERTTYVGIDAHRKDLFVSRRVSGQPQIDRWQVANEAGAITRLIKKLERDAPGRVLACYEAGPCGYALQRQLTTARITCQVVAPALMPTKPGERVKTNRRDADKLQEYLAAGLLTEVHPPTTAAEAVRDLCRSREDAREDLQRARHRLSKLLLRQGLHYGGTAWTQAHSRWLDRLSWPEAATRTVVEHYRLMIDQVETCLRHLDEEIRRVAETEPYTEPVAWLRCLHGVDTLTAMMVLAELHDIRRFESPRALMAYLGLVPSEHSSGERHRRGPITRAGNALARRLLVEAAWHYQRAPRVGRKLAQRRKGQPPAVLAVAAKAQQRLCARFQRLLARQKSRPLIVVAIARELVGFVWAILQQEPPARAAA